MALEESLQEMHDKQLKQQLLIKEMQKDIFEAVETLGIVNQTCQAAKTALRETMAEMDKPETNFGKVRYNLQYIFNCLTNVCG